MRTENREFSKLVIKRLMTTAILFLASLLSISLLAYTNAKAETPNIVLIFIDDMGYADIGPFGNTQVKTPHLDALAKQGRRFTSFYAAPTCTMARARLMTGCYNTRIGLSGVLTPGSRGGLNPKETTIAEVVKQKGYATSCVGKWHLGHLPAFLPTSQGFDDYFGLPYSNDMHAKRKQKGEFMPPLPLMRGEEIIETEPDQAYLTKRYTEEAVKFIETQKDAPFFLYLAHTMVHFPLAASPEFEGKSKMGLIGDTIEEIDWSVGQIIQTLEGLGLRQETLVIFTSDNGPARRDAPPLRGGKSTNWEGGVRVPTIMTWPGKIPPNTSCEHISGLIDILPTFAAITGAQLDPSRIIDGKDISRLLFDEDPAAVHDSELYYLGGRKTPDGIRKGDWKLLVQYPARSTDPDQTDGPWLYNLKDDVSESKNLAKQHPKIVLRLTEELNRRGEEVIKNSRPAGRGRL